MLPYLKTKGDGKIMATKKTTSAAPAVEKATEKVVEKAVEKKAPAKKTTAPAKTTAPKKTANVVIEFAGNQYLAKEIVAKCEADYKAKSKTAIKTIDVYIQPDNGVAYYVVNGEANGDKVDL